MEQPTATWFAPPEDAPPSEMELEGALEGWQSLHEGTFSHLPLRPEAFARPSEDLSDAIGSFEAEPPRPVRALRVDAGLTYFGQGFVEEDAPPPEEATPEEAPVVPALPEALEWEAAQPPEPELETACPPDPEIEAAHPLEPELETAYPVEPEQETVHRPEPEAQPWPDPGLAAAPAAPVPEDREDELADLDAEPAWQRVGTSSALELDGPGPAWAEAGGEDPAWADAPLDPSLREPEGYELTPLQDTEAEIVEDAEGFFPEETAWLESDASETGDEPQVVHARIASPSARALGWLVDGSLIAGAVGGAIWMAARVAGVDTGLAAASRDPVLAGLALLLASVVGVVYTALFTLAGGQTVGGRLAGVRILDARGLPPDAPRAFGRAVAAAVGVLAFLVGLVWVLLDDRGQALHDRVSRTFAVKAS